MIFHRAFSLFVVDSRERVLLQRRSASKITYPLFWSNSVCSHPVFDLDEREEAEAMGVRRAAQRRLREELGLEHCALEDFLHIGSFAYQSKYSEQWGESEVDHVLLLRRDFPDDHLLHLNSEEVECVRWVEAARVLEFLGAFRARKDSFTPWFLTAFSMVLPYLVHAN